MQSDSRRIALSVVFLASLSVASCSNQDPTPASRTQTQLNEMAVIRVDDLHNQLAVEEGQEKATYRIPPARALTIDASDYTLVVPSNAPEGVSEPNAVQIAFAGSVHVAAWNAAQNKGVVSPDTSRLLNGPEEFAGMAAGAHGLVAIGHQQIKGATVHFFPFWAALFEVADHGSPPEENAARDEKPTGPQK